MGDILIDRLLNRTCQPSGSPEVKCDCGSGLVLKDLDIALFAGGTAASVEYRDAVVAALGLKRKIA